MELSELALENEFMTAQLLKVVVRAEVRCAWCVCCF